MSSEVRDEKLIPQLTGLRAIAAYMVFLHNVPFLSPFIPSVIAGMITELHVGVTLFFVLSGFLIYRNYFHTFKNSRHWWSVYINNRIARIYPVYFAATLVTLIFSNISLEIEWFLNLTFLRGFSEPFKYSAVAQGWSLTPEWCFYLSAPMVFALTRRGFFWLGLFLVMLAGLGLWILGGYINFYYLFQGTSFFFSHTYFGRCFEFFAGMYLARLLDAQKDRPAPRGPFHTFAALGLIAATIYAMSLYQSVEYPLGVDHPIGRILNNWVLPVFYCLLFYGLIMEKTLLQRFLASPPMILLGKTSYAFYLVHMGLFERFVDWIVPLHGSFTHYVGIFLTLNLFAIAIYFCWERPMNRFLRHLVDHRKYAADPASEVAVTQATCP